MALAISDVDLSHLDARERFRQPRAALLEVGCRALERERTLVQLLRALVDLREPSLSLAHVTDAARELRLLDGELRGAFAQPLLAGRVPHGRFLELLVAGLVRALAFFGGGDTRRQRGLLSGNSTPGHLEVGGPRLEVGRARVQLAECGVLEALLLRDLGRTCVDLGFSLRENLGTPLVRLQRGARGRDPLAALFELGAENAQLAGTDVELASPFPEPLRLRGDPCELVLVILDLLLCERHAAFALLQLGLGLLDQLPAHVEVAADLLVAARPRVDLRRTAADRLVQQALALRERGPGLLELVVLVRHPPNDDEGARPQGSVFQAVYSCMGGLVVSVVLALAATNPGCGGGKPVVAISYGVQNDVDTGIRGNDWAYDTYTRSVRVWRRSPRNFCAVSTYDGSFASIAGASPGGKWQLPGGVRGGFTGVAVTTFRGRFRPNASPVRGFLGAKGAWEWSNDYFSGIAAFRYMRYTFRYRAKKHGTGTWTDTLADGKRRHTGDIKPSKR